MVPSPAIRVLQLIVKVPPPTSKVSSSGVKMPLILQRQGRKRLSLRDVLMAKAIDLDVWIFTPVPRWALTVVVCDNDLE
jgi:hypothetical protein